MRAERWGRNVGRSWKWMRTQIWWSLEILDCGTRSSYFEFKRAPAFGSTLFYTYSLQWEWMNERTNEWNEWMSSLTCFSFLFFSFSIWSFTKTLLATMTRWFLLYSSFNSLSTTFSLYTLRDRHTHTVERERKREFGLKVEREREREREREGCGKWFGLECSDKNKNYC